MARVTSVTSIEAVVVVPGGPSAVWSTLLDQERWRDWEHEGVRLRLEGVELLDNAFVRVGDRRRCAAQLTRLPLIGTRRVAWEELVTDVEHERTIELQAVASRSSIRGWRIRFWLLAQSDQRTRLRCRVSYRPASAGGWLADRLFLRARVAEAADAWLGSLAASLTPAAESESEEAAGGAVPARAAAGPFRGGGALAA